MTAFEQVNNTQQTGLGRSRGMGNWLNNLAVLWKIALIALVLAIGMLLLVITSLSFTAVLRFHTNNLYSFMLIPISSLQEARLKSIETVRTLEVLDSSQTVLDTEQKQGVFDQAKDYAKQINEIIDRYSKEWVTTTSPEFTAILQKYGQQKAQDSEVLQLKELNALNTRMNATLDAFIKAKGNTPVGSAELTSGYFEISDRLQDLINLNLDFAKLSDQDAAIAGRNGVILEFVVFGVVLLVGIGTVALIARSITQRLAKLETAARALRSGNLDFEADVSGRDEIGLVSGALNTSVAQLKNLLSEQNLERERGIALQANVSQFLGVAMDIAGGDLTKKGQVTDDALGNVVDAINLMTEEFGALLGNVRAAANRVSSGANTMTETSQSILGNVQSQAALAKGAESQTNRVAQAMQSLAMTADKGATAAQFTLEASSVGTQAVAQTREQFTAIRTQMLEMVQGMQNLAQRSDEINEVVRTISRFASQTNLLALGASLEAAGAGSAGARFGAVANAVRTLADDSAKAASRITGIVKDVQTEIQSLSVRASDGATQVQKGTEIAAQAGERLDRISDLAKQSSQVAQDIAALATEQAESVEAVRENVTQIALTAQTTETGTRQGGAAASELQTLSQSLTQSLERFRLPSAAN